MAFVDIMAAFRHDCSTHEPHGVSPETLPAAPMLLMIQDFPSVMTALVSNHIVPKLSCPFLEILVQSGCSVLFPVALSLH